MVDQIRGDIDKIHQGRLQGAANLLGGFAFHGFRCALPAPLGGHLCMKVSFRKEEKNPKSDGVCDHAHWCFTASFSLCSFSSLNQEKTFQWNQQHHTPQWRVDLIGLH